MFALGDVPISVIEKFALRIQEQDENEEKPVYTENGVTYVYIKYNNLYVLSVTKRNTNVTLVMLFMYKVCSVFKEYFGEVSEESIRDNFVIIYELLDEMMDFGYVHSPCSCFRPSRRGLFWCAFLVLNC